MPDNSEHAPHPCSHLRSPQRVRLEDGAEKKKIYPGPVESKQLASPHMCMCTQLPLPQGSLGNQRLFKSSTVGIGCTCAWETVTSREVASTQEGQLAGPVGGWTPGGGQISSLCSPHLRHLLVSRAPTGLLRWF